MARNVRWAVTHKETVSQAVEVLHNVGLCGGPASTFEIGIRTRAMGPWPEGRLATGLRVLGVMSLLANHNHFFELESHAMQIPQVLKGVGEAIFTGMAARDQNLTRDVGELSQQYRGFSNVLAEAEDQFISARHLQLCDCWPNTAAETQPRHCSADVHMIVVPCDRGAGGVLQKP